MTNTIYDIHEYEKIYEDYEECWYEKFINLRIKDKQIEGYNPNLTEKSILFLQNDKSFTNYFKEFLKLKIKTDFYVEIENKIVNDSREETLDGSLGHPTINSILREKNYKYSLSLGQNCDNMYNLISEYLNFIENINSEFNFVDFLEIKIY